MEEFKRYIERINSEMRFRSDGIYFDSNGRTSFIDYTMMGCLTDKDDKKEMLFDERISAKLIYLFDIEPELCKKISSNGTISDYGADGDVQRLLVSYNTFVKCLENFDLLPLTPVAIKNTNDDGYRCFLFLNKKAKGFWKVSEYFYVKNIEYECKDRSQAMILLALAAISTIEYTNSDITYYPFETFNKGKLMEAVEIENVSEKSITINGKEANVESMRIYRTPTNMICINPLLFACLSKYIDFSNKTLYIHSNGNVKCSAECGGYGDSMKTVQFIDVKNAVCSFGLTPIICSIEHANGNHVSYTYSIYSCTPIEGYEKIKFGDIYSFRGSEEIESEDIAYSSCILMLIDALMKLTNKSK